MRERMFGGGCFGFLKTAIFLRNFFQVRDFFFQVTTLFFSISYYLEFWDQSSGEKELESYPRGAFSCCELPS